jgi:hypothetical protein
VRLAAAHIIHRGHERSATLTHLFGQRSRCTLPVSGCCGKDRRGHPVLVDTAWGKPSRPSRYNLMLRRL